MDASSEFQGSLPVSSDQLLRQLDAWGITYTLHQHVPLRTVADSQAIEAQFTVSGEKALRVKNLYLRDKKKRNYLVTLSQDRDIDLKVLAAHLGGGSLSFGSADRLMQNLGVRPGAVSPLAMITGVQKGVEFYLDDAARHADRIYVHPLVNDRTLAMALPDFLTFLKKIECPVHWLE